MIQEPQQPEMIEIPLITSMSSRAKSLPRNKLLNNQKKTNSQRTRIIQVPQQSSKPRIFLLTKPSQAPVIRLETQTVQPHNQKNSNLSQILHSEKTVTANLATVPSLSQIETIRTPFLPRSQLQTCSVKSNQVKSKALNRILKKDLEINPVRKQDQTQVTQFADYTLQENPIIQEVIHLSPDLTENSSNQLHEEQEVSKHIIAANTANNLSLPENKHKVIVSQAQAQAQPEIPLTLASMAGIELTGAEMSLSQVDMSGAMPPTATVEELNVPVFIDEYLQEVTTSGTANNIFNNNNNSNNISDSISNDNSNEIGIEVKNFLDLDNFEFDINLLTENSSKDTKMALEVKEDEQDLHQYQLTKADNDNIKQHQLELQMMLEKLLLNNNSNNTTFNNNNNNNIDNMANSIDLTDDLFKVAPYTELNDFLSPDDIENSSFGTTQFNSEEAIDLNSISKDFSLDECFINSQPTEIMFSCGYSQSQSSSQNLINEISKAEPHISLATTSETAAIHISACDLNDEVVETLGSSQYTDENSFADYKNTNHLKRRSSLSNQHLLEKRLKLRLDTKLCRENVLYQQPEISTPKVVDFIDQFNDITAGTTTVDSIKSIYYDLIASSPKCVSVKSEIVVDDTTNDFSPPNTPYSVNSVSNQTSFINTAPSSPASSTATTSNGSLTVKRGRGRPAKTHSDIPDRSQIQHLSETEQKKVLERAKNNEASRKSRLKHKERDNALEREEAELKKINVELQAEWEKLMSMEKKLRAAMKRQYLQF